jgi:hypothetical protein
MKSLTYRLSVGGDEARSLSLFIVRWSPCGNDGLLIGWKATLDFLRPLAGRSLFTMLSLRASGCFPSVSALDMATIGILYLGAPWFVSCDSSATVPRPACPSLLEK